MTNKVKERIRFHYLLTEIQLFTLILLGLNIFHKNYWAKSKINQTLRTYLEYNMLTLLCVDFIVWLS